MNSPFLSEYAPKEEKQAILASFKKKRLPFHISFINDYYNITEELHRNYQNIELPQKIALGYTIFYSKYENIGFYFRHLYRILRYIKDSEDEEVAIRGKAIEGRQEKMIRDKYKQYAQFIQAQMSIYEHVLVFYNSFVFPKMQELILYYGLLENLTIQNLVCDSHNCIEKMNLKNKKDLFQLATRKEV